MNFRIIKGISITLCLFTVIASGYGTDARIQRWQERSASLTALLSTTGSSDIPQIVRDILGRGIESSNSIKSLLERYAARDGSLRADTRKYSVSEIESRTSEIAIPVISAWYLNAVNDRLSDPEYFTKVLAWIAACANTAKVDGIKAGAPNVNELVRGYIMEMAIAHYPAFESSSLKKILGATQYELSRTDYNSNDIDFEKIIMEKSIKEMQTAVKEFNPQFSETLLGNVPEWKLLESRAISNRERERSAETFATRHNIPQDQISGKGVEHSGRIIFSNARRTLSTLINQSADTGSTAIGNPAYSIPDLKKLNSAVDAIDKYRAGLLRKVDGATGKSFSSTARENMRGIAEKHIRLYESAYKKEELRITGIKKNNAKVIIYNEEVFIASKKHFSEIKTELMLYAELSSDFIEAVSSAGTSTPVEYLESLRYTSERYAEYITFMENLAGKSAELGKMPDPANHGVVKEGIKDSLEYIRRITKSFTVPPEFRKNMTKEQVGQVSKINQSYRAQLTSAASSIRRKYDEYNSLYNEALAGKKKANTESEVRIAQLETDALFAFAKECTDAVLSMNSTDQFLKEYKNTYETINDEIKKSGSSGRYTDAINSGSILQLVKTFTPGSVEKETAGREILAREGNEALSGAVTLCRYYAGRGIRVELVPPESEIRRMREVLNSQPGLRVADWTMTGRNFREIDINCTEKLRKMTEKNAWKSPADTGSESRKEIITYAGVNVTFEPPPGWNTSEIKCESGSAMKFESPDRSGWIEVYAIPAQPVNLQDFSSSWSGERGFSMVEKGWGRINSEDYFRTVCKGRNNRISETRMFSRKGVVIIVSGYSGKNKARYMNGIIEKLFSGIIF